MNSVEHKTCDIFKFQILEKSLSIVEDRTEKIFIRTQVPDRDLATARASTSEPARYAPPVHVPPRSPFERSHQTPRVARAMFDGESVNGRRNTTQQTSYAGRPTVTKLNDDSLAMPDSTPVPVATREIPPARNMARNDNAANRFVGLHGFKSEPAPAAQPRQQTRIRRPGLQDHISAALKRTSGAKRSEPTEAVRDEDYTAAQNARVTETATLEQPARHRFDQASRSLKRHRVASHENRRNIRPERVDQYDESLEPVEFATDYRRPINSFGSDDQRESDRVDEEIMPTARMTAVQSPDRLRSPRVSQSTRGQQVSILSRSRQEAGGETENDFEDVPNRLRTNRQIEKLDDFVPIDDGPDQLGDVDDSFDSEDDLDDLDRDIDAELRRMRERSDDDESEDDDDDSMAKLPIKDCDTFRRELLDSSIRDIALDISPPASSLPGSPDSIGRSWTDPSGNVIATGAMQDLRRGYVILDSGQKVAHARLSESSLAAVSEFWRLPTICSVGNRGSVQRNWIPQTFTWTASNLCHKTLFFENVQLERYGHSHGPFTQPVQSVAHFFVSLATVPYQAAIHPANECQYALGYYRPGNCAPWLKDPIPISLDGARRQALLVTGAAFLP